MQEPMRPSAVVTLFKLEALLLLAKYIIGHLQLVYLAQLLLNQQHHQVQQPPIR